jgi:hypothetical protein
LFGLDAYGQSVKRLYDELIDYLNTASENIELCLEVIEREKYMRQHPEEIIEVHNKCYQDTFNHSQSTIKRFLNSGTNTDNDIVKAIEEADDAKETIAELFHMLNVDQWNDYVICRATNEARNIGLTKEELFLWGRDRREQVMRVRKLLRHLDELDIEKVKKGKALSGYFLMRLFNWCDIKDNSQHGVLRDYIAKNYKGLVVKNGKKEVFVTVYTIKELTDTKLVLVNGSEERTLYNLPKDQVPKVDRPHSSPKKIAANPKTVLSPKSQEEREKELIRRVEEQLTGKK